MKKEMSENLWMQKSWVKMLHHMHKLLCVCKNSQIQSKQIDKEEEIKTTFPQTFDRSKNEQIWSVDCDNCVADDTDKISVCYVSNDTEDNLSTPGSLDTAKRRRLR